MHQLGLAVADWCGAQRGIDQTRVLDIVESIEQFCPDQSVSPRAVCRTLKHCRAEVFYLAGLGVQLNTAQIRPAGHLLVCAKAGMTQERSYRGAARLSTWVRHHVARKIVLAKGLPMC
jgi:hypothetical protein